MYRIPKIEEFVEGFEFEVYMKSGGGSFCIMDLRTSGLSESEKEQMEVNRLDTVEKWEPFIVPELHGLSLEWHFPFSIEYFLKQNKIRTKVKK